MISATPLLSKLILLVDLIPQPPPPEKRKRGRPQTYNDTLFLKVLIIMIIKRLHKVGEVLAVLDQPDMAHLRVLLTHNGRYPSRRTWERRLKKLPQGLPALIGCLGRELVGLIQPWAECGRAVAIDSTLLRARGGVWHKKDRQAEHVPHSRSDTEANGTKSGWHGWVYGWKLHLVTTVAAVWIPLAAELTPANEADNNVALLLLPQLPEQVRYVLGDTHYNAPNVEAACDEYDLILVTTKRGPYPHTDEGVEVRRVFHKLRSLAIENFNEHFKGIFEGHEQVPTKGLVATQRFALGAILVYQLGILYRYKQGLSLNQGLKAFLRAA